MMDRRRPVGIRDLMPKIPMPKKYDEKKLGYERIFPLQQRVAEKAMKMLLDNEKAATKNKRSPLIIMQPQGGKTGVMAETASQFIDDCIARKRTYQIVSLCGLPHLDLMNQTRDRLTENLRDGDIPVGAQLHVKVATSRLHRYPTSTPYQREGIVIRHNSPKLRRLDLNAPVDVRLWLADEVHLGNVKDGNIDLMLQNHGVRICDQIHTWDNGRTINHVVGVSATPSAHMIKSDNLDLQGESLFHWIYEPPPDDYNSLARMRANLRLRQTQPLFLDNGLPSDFLLQVHRDFLKACKTQGPGHLVIRATGERNDRLMDFINRRGRGIECLPFDAKLGNIDELNKRLSVQPSEPTIVVIRGSMRAGMTLGIDNSIRGWVETESATSDSQAQSGVGRACGYGRNAETYPIYCDLDHVDKWIATYDALDKNKTPEVPPGIQNRGLGARRRYTFLEILPHDEAWKKYVLPARDNDKRKGITGHALYRHQLANTADSVFLDVAGMFLEGRRDSGSTKGIHVNGPTTDAAVHKFLKMHFKKHKAKHPDVTEETVWGWQRRNRESYKKLIAKHPEATSPKYERAVRKDPKLDGNAIIFNEDAITTIDLDQSRDGLQKKRSAVRK